MLTALQRDRRTRRMARFTLESLDDRIVLSAAAAGAAAEAAASTRAALLEQRHEARAAKLEARAEARAVKVEAREEARLARAEAKEEAKLARAEGRENSSVGPVVVGTSSSPTAPVTPAPPSTPAPTVVAAPAATASSGNPTSAAGTATVTTATPVNAAVTTTTPATSTSTGTTTTLPSTVSAALQALYAEYEGQGGGSTFTPSEPNDSLLQISGTSVGVNIKVSATASFSTVLSQLESDGLQVSASSSTYGLISGMLPIADLPTVAQLDGAGSVTSAPPAMMR